jgi:hypothetical protein
VNPPDRDFFEQMEWSGSNPRKPRLGVRMMLLALVLAAFLGGALGLVWHSDLLGGGEPAAESAAASAG